MGYSRTEQWLLHVGGTVQQEQVALRLTKGCLLALALAFQKIIIFAGISLPMSITVSYVLNLCLSCCSKFSHALHRSLCSEGMWDAVRGGGDGRGSSLESAVSDHRIQVPGAVGHGMSLHIAQSSICWRRFLVSEDG